MSVRLSLYYTDTATFWFLRRANVLLYIRCVCVCECAQRYHLFFVGRIYTQTHTCLYTPKHTTKNSPIFLQRFFTNNFQIFYINFITIVYTSTKTIVLFVFYRVFVVNIHKNNKIFTQNAQNHLFQPCFIFYVSLAVLRK